MFHANMYRKAFWTGCIHALMIVLYAIFISLVWLSVVPYIEVITPGMSIVLAMFIMMLSAAVIAYIIFFAPMKLIVHHQFKAATILMGSTFGWLFVCLCIGVITLFIAV